VLILCTGNSARSQLAEAILRHVAGGAVHVESAGTAPQPEIHPLARRAAQLVLDLDMEGQHPKSVDRFLGQPFDYVITVCDRAAESCPAFPGAAERIHWSVDDPAAAEGDDDQRQRAFDATARELVARIEQWLALPAIRRRVEGS
jgi:protein-tyrosine-phosphatase